MNNQTDLFEKLSSYFRQDDYFMRSITDIETMGEKLKQKGMKQSESHANELVTNWSDLAMNALKRYLRYISYDDTFFAEDIRQYAYEFCLLEQPPSQRAWGSILIQGQEIRID